MPRKQLAITCTRMTSAIVTLLLFSDDKSLDNFRQTVTDRTRQFLFVSWQIFTVYCHRYIQNWWMLDAQWCLQPHGLSRRKHRASCLRIMTVNMVVWSRDMSIQLLRLSAVKECVDKSNLCHDKLTTRCGYDTRGDTPDEADSRFGNCMA